MNLVIPMRYENSMTIDEVAEIIERDIDKFSELVTNIQRDIYGKKTVIIVFEKFYFRTSSYANLTVVLSETQEGLYADIIGSGGGNGLFNICLGSNLDFARKAEKVLKNIGFKNIEEEQYGGYR